MLAILFPAIDPVAIQIGPLAIRWYALAYLIGFVAGWRYCIYLARKDERPPTAVDFDDFLTWAVVGVILGGRLGYVLFYNTGYYFNNPLEALAVWHGGMSFHGGMLGVIAAIFLFSHKRGFSPLALGDLISCAVPIGLFFGRIANFVNAELWGRVTDVPWGVIFPGERAGGLPRHPSQLYEAALEGLLLFVVLAVLAQRPAIRNRPGTLGGIFLVGYGLCRIFAEHFREPDPQLGFLLGGNVTMGQILSVPMVLVGLALILIARRRGERAGELKIRVRGMVPEFELPESELAEHLKRRIAVEGPVSVSSFMGDALGHPKFGYYITADRFGAAGDFITAPEISQMFGELIGLWCAHSWAAMGSPDRVNLVELGPGRGTLMRDALRAAAMLPPFREALRVHLVETSPVLRARQGEVLSPALQGREPVWHDSLATVPDGPLLVIANEFFDALPIRQFEKTTHGWTERLVDTDPESGSFRIVLDRRPGPVEALIPARVRISPVGSVFEVCPVAIAIARELGARLVASGGAAVIVDYGHPCSAAGETLQAVRRHAFVPVLDDPGSADLTAHVDFEILADAARAGGANAWGPITQGGFLTALGIRERAAMLRQQATPKQAADIDGAVQRLIGETEMGTLFKVLALTGPGYDAPAGFEPSSDPMGKP